MWYLLYIIIFNTSTSGKLEFNINIQQLQREPRYFEFPLNLILPTYMDKFHDPMH